jgi:hypothetical protein
MVADAVIYHPAVSHYLRYVATTGKRSRPALLYLPTTSTDGFPPADSL